jgi:hypothetical protein
LQGDSEDTTLLKTISFYSTRNRVIPNYLIQSRRHGELLQLPDQTLTSGSTV